MTNIVASVADAICEAGAAFLPAPLHQRKIYEAMAKAAIIKLKEEELLNKTPRFNDLKSLIEFLK